MDGFDLGKLKTIKIVRAGLDLPAQHSQSGSCFKTLVLNSAKKSNVFDLMC